jgi:hypothetical protein
MPCYRCGVRQTDPERGKSPWRRGVVRDQLVLVCPACQESGDWTVELESCARCGSVHLIRRLGQVDCLDCGLVREPAASLVTTGAPGSVRPVPATSGDATSGDSALSEEVGRALDRLLGRR